MLLAAWTTRSLRFARAVVGGSDLAGRRAIQSTHPHSPDGSDAGRSESECANVPVSASSTPVLRDIDPGRWAVKWCGAQGRYTIQETDARVPGRPVERKGGDPELGSRAVKAMFDRCWQRIEGTLNQTICPPREIVWLNGAPGAGKGVNTNHILDIRGLSRAVNVSDLLSSYPDAKALMDEGLLVPDHTVIEALLQAILNPTDNDGNGLIVDGFPRTPLQVEMVQVLFTKLMDLHTAHRQEADADCYPRPSFKVVVLYVDEKTSVERQVARAQKAVKANMRLGDAGARKHLRETRTTDLDVSKAMARYDTFKRHYSAILKLKDYFPFSLIDAMGSLEDCATQIAHELRYQSSLDLDEDVYRLVTGIPLVTEIVKAARMSLVKRLNGYSKKHMALLEEVVGILHTEVLPQIRRCGQAGFTEYRSDAAPFSTSPLACEMLIDVLSDRGFSCSHIVEESMVPWKIDMNTGIVTNKKCTTHRFRVTFATVTTRAAHIAQTTAGAGSPAQGEDRIGYTHMPQGLDHSEKPEMPRDQQGAYKKGHQIAPDK